MSKGGQEFLVVGGPGFSLQGPGEIVRGKGNLERGKRNMKRVKEEKERGTVAEPFFGRRCLFSCGEVF